MGYDYTCDDCGHGYGGPPPFMGEFRESFLEATEAGGLFAEAGYRPGQTVTLCADCMERVL